MDFTILQKANIPIIMGYIDYRRKAGGLGPHLIPTGDIEADMVKIRSFYSSVTGKYPEKMVESPVVNFSVSG